jgi:hypothetical protein
MLKVFLGGEGNNDLGTRWHRPSGDSPGVIEVLLRRVRPDGWHVAGVQDWKSIRKYRAGAARKRPDHEDTRNIFGLVLQAYEEACEMLVFVRDLDGDELREPGILQALEAIPTLGFADDYHYELAVVGGIAKPALEGWILCLLGVTGTDDMTRARAARELATTDVDPKSTAQYVAIAETRALPRGHGSLPAWLARADTTFCQLIDGVDPP